MALFPALCWVLPRPSLSPPPPRGCLLFSAPSSFPVGFAMIVVLGLELVTGSFAMLPAAFLARRVGLVRMLTNLLWVFLGNLIGGCLYAWMYACVQTQFHHVPAAGAGALIVAAAQAKTLGYEKLGATGIWLAVLKAMLCNWMVCMGVVMGLTSRSTLGKIAGCWLPIFTFFALGYEHSVVNMFLIPAGIWMGAPVSYPRMVALESAPRHAWQSHRRTALRRLADAVDRQCRTGEESRTFAHSLCGAGPGCRRGLIFGPALKSVNSLHPHDGLTSGSRVCRQCRFSPEEKKCLENIALQLLRRFC